MVSRVKSKENELKQLIEFQPYEEQVRLTIYEFDNCHAQIEEVKEVQDRIDAIIKEVPYMKVPIPVKWNTFLCEIEGSGKNTWTVKEALSEMGKWKITDEDELQNMLKSHHDTGHIIYHKGCELIVLRPQFLNSIISNIITVFDDKKVGSKMSNHYKELCNKGILHIDIIKDVWKEHKGEGAQLEDIIDMMIKFDLICEIPDTNTDDGERRFFVPCRSSPTLNAKENYPRGDEIEFIIDFYYFLPDGFLHRLYVRMAKWSMKRHESLKPTFHCRQMNFFIDHDHRVVMNNDIDNKDYHQIKVTIFAVNPLKLQSNRPMVSINEDIIHHLDKTLEDLKDRWAKRVKYTVGILCSSCKEHEDKKDKINLIPLEDILRVKGKNATCSDGCPMDVSHILKAFNKHPEGTYKAPFVSIQ
ncbi:uncharacterized protein LOC129267159 [Lytechinus pictus]|uniref:uncharacterized protein LOC129267159 n=1 Tax=Lytechinus pictus TaxID=7653 RepID=UPI0030B9E266